MSPETSTQTRELVMTREFDAPPELVFKAWTDPEMVKQWWGPHEFTTPVAEIDARVGGKMLFCMRSSEGQDIWGGGEILEFDPPSKFVVTDDFMDKDGNKVPPSTYGMPEEWPEGCKITVTFEESGGKTKMTMRQAPLPASMADGANEGWSQSFEKLEKLLAA